MVSILEENESNWLIATESGTTTKTKSSDLNQLLYGHDLFGLIEDGTQIWQNSGAEGEPSVTLIPGEEAKKYTIEISEAPKLTLGKHHKTDLIDALAAVYEEHDGNSVQPILDLYDSIREDMIREDVLRPFADALSDKVVVRDDGWFINGHLLLTLEGDMFHPDTKSHKRSGSQCIPLGSKEDAYSVNIDNPSQSMSRSVSVDGEEYRLTTKEMHFIAKAMWSVENTPDRT
jgi:hypothetical protein